MATGAIMGVTVQGADQGDTTTIAETVTVAAEALEAVAAATDGHTAVIGYGNDSRQTGPLSSRIHHNDAAGRFAFPLRTRTRLSPSRMAEDPARHGGRPVIPARSAVSVATT